MHFCEINKLFFNRIGGVMTIVLASSVVDHGFNLWSGQTKFVIAVYPLSTPH